eukprot:3606929-Rhodomonas_salina.2
MDLTRNQTQRAISPVQRVRGTRRKGADSTCSSSTPRHVSARSRAPSAASFGLQVKTPLSSVKCPLPVKETHVTSTRPRTKNKNVGGCDSTRPDPRTPASVPGRGPGSSMCDVSTGHCVGAA